MNFIDISRIIMSGEKLSNLHLRVCYYARVSTDSDVQINSLENQLRYYEEYIRSKPNWVYVDGYIDEGISGVSVEKRIAFKRMIYDARLNKFDLIITKEVSRFARDLEDSIHYIRLLKDLDVGVYFENQNLNTFDNNSELILNIMFNLAQDESRKLSSRVKFGQREAIKNGHVLGSSNIIGYKKEKCKLVIVPDEAKLIKIIFELYSSGEYGLTKLAKKLGGMGYYNKKGNLYDKETLKRIIENPKYKGYYRGRTTEVVDYRTKKRVKFNKDEQIIYECSSDIVPAIVSCELWNKANLILSSRAQNSFTRISNGNLKYPFSSKIYCGEHYTNFGRSHGSKRKNRPVWCCGLYLQYRLDSCCSPIIAEADLNNIFLRIMNKVLTKKNEIINDLYNLYEKVGWNGKYDMDLSYIDKELKIIEEKKSFILNLVFSGDIKLEEMREQLNSLEKKKGELEHERNLILNSINYYSNGNNIYDEIQRELSGDILNEFIREFVHEVVVFKINNERYNIKLDIYLNLFGKIIGNRELRHINGPYSSDRVFLLNQKCSSIEKLRRDRKSNLFTYNVYFMSLNGSNV